MTNASTTIVWFRGDLRRADHPALHEAARRGAVVPLYIHAPEEEGAWPPGGAARWWLHQSLEALDRSLRAAGSRLILRRGPAGEALRSVLGETAAAAVFWSRRHEPAIGDRDARVEGALRREGVTVETFEASLLFAPGAIRSRGGAPLRVFSPFYRACLAAAPPLPPRPRARRLQAPRRWPRSEPLAALELLPRPDWAGGLRAAWRPGEDAASRLLKRLTAHVASRYAATRDRPGEFEGTSSLSPHLRFGEVGPRQIWHALEAAPGAGPCAFLRELLWREFAWHLLAAFPRTPEAPLRPEFERFPWSPDPALLRAWTRGETGYPIVDAAMRSLWTTGWMHNRARMIAASFLVKDLLQPWQDGARWFWDTLVDADLGNNTLGWQWVAGCGADAAPYFRVFNPVRQGEKFDPDGAYVRRWVPELARLPRRFIHRPWQAPAAVLAAAGVVLGRDYPWPVVDHAAARLRALAAWRRMRGRT